jgi:hypothetical protein
MPSVKASPVDWQFQGRSENLVALRHDALAELESIVRDSLGVSDTGPSGDFTGMPAANFTRTA